VAQRNPQANIWPRLVLRPKPVSRKVKHGEQENKTQNLEQQNRPVAKIDSGTQREPKPMRNHSQPKSVCRAWSEDKISCTRVRLDQI
jgi:hypothetical protein